MTQQNFHFKDYTITIKSLKAEIEAIGSYTAEEGDHYTFIIRPFRIYLPELNITIRETYCLDPFYTQQELQKAPTEYSYYPKNQEDPTMLTGTFYSLKSLKKDLQQSFNLSLYKINKLDCIFILDDLE